MCARTPNKNGSWDCQSGAVAPRRLLARACPDSHSFRPLRRCRKGSGASRDPVFRSGGVVSNGFGGSSSRAGSAVCVCCHRRGQSNATHEVAESWIGAQRLEHGFYEDRRQSSAALRVGPLEPRECLILVSESRIGPNEPEGREGSAWPCLHALQLLDQFERLATMTGTPMGVR